MPQPPPPMSVPVAPLLRVWGEPVQLVGAQLRPDINWVEQQAIVSLDTVVQSEGLYLRQSHLDAAACEDDGTKTPLAMAAVGQRVWVREKSYAVQLVQHQTDPGWVRVIIA